MPKGKKVPENQEKEKPTTKKDYVIAVTEDEYDAHREELEKLDNVIIFVDDADRTLWMDGIWGIGAYREPDD